jgi:hypothetical protein
MSHTGSGGEGDGTGIDEEDLEGRVDRLEGVVARQQQVIDAQRKRLERVTSDEERGTDGESTTRESTTTVSRRGALTAGGLLAMLGLGVGTAGADPQGQVGTASDPLTALYTGAVYAGTTGRIELVGGSGVSGTATDTSGRTTGVHGETRSGDDEAAGVVGTAPNGRADGVYGNTRSTDDTSHGVRGDAPGTGGRAVAGYNRSDEQVVRQWAGPMGVYGESNDDAGWGVFGYNSSTESTTGGVTGRAESPDAAGVLGQNSGGGPALRADGFVEIEHDGAWASPARSGLRQTVPGGEPTRIEFGYPGSDPLGEFDFEENTFRPEHDGDYRVNVQIGWGFVTQGARVETNVNVVDSSVATDVDHMPLANNEASYKTTSVSKTLELLADYPLSVSVEHNGDHPVTIDARESATYAEFVRVG